MMMLSYTLTTAISTMNSNYCLYNTVLGLAARSLTTFQGSSLQIRLEVWPCVPSASFLDTCVGHADNSLVYIASYSCLN